jgi:hypothetical protein
MRTGNDAGTPDGHRRGGDELRGPRPCRGAMSDIKPALTPEQWDKLHAKRHSDYWDPEDEFSGHGLAAMYLYEHGNGVGFAWEDVALLQDLDSLLSRDYGDTEVTRGLRSLADRIESLLPPREP